MKVVNTKTGKDVTSYYLQYMEGKITKENFEELSELESKNLKIKLKKNGL